MRATLSRAFLVAALAAPIAGLPLDHHDHALTHGEGHAVAKTGHKLVSKKRKHKKFKYLSNFDDSAEITEGMNPHHMAGQQSGDANRFKYRFQHYKQGSLTYYEYDATRGEHVKFLEAKDDNVPACSAKLHLDGNHSAHLLLTKNQVRELDLKAGSILVGRGVDCKMPDGTVAKLQDRVVTPPEVTRHKSGKMEVSFTIRPANMHEMFKDMTVEYFRGKPKHFHNSRSRRLKSLKRMGKPDKAQGFPNSHKILADARAAAQRKDHMSTAKMKAIHATPQPTKDKNHRKDEEAKRLIMGHTGEATVHEESCGYCYSCYSADVGATADYFWGADCSNKYDVGSYVDAANGDLNCLMGYDGEFTLMYQGKYQFAWHPLQETYQSALIADLYEYDDYSGNDYCLQLKTQTPENTDSGGYRVDDQPTYRAFDLHSGVTRAGTPIAGKNSRILYMPTMDELNGNDCMSDGWGGYPEFVVGLMTAQNDDTGTDDSPRHCEDDYCLTNGCTMLWSTSADGGPGIGYFRLMDVDDKPLDMELDMSFDKSEEYTSGDFTASYQITCTDCGIDLEGATHVVIRTSNYLPFEEMWTLTNAEIEGKVDFTAVLKASWSKSHVFELRGQTCVAPMCYGATLCGIGVEIGMRAGLSVELSVAFNAQLTLEFKRSMKQVATVGFHAIRTSGVSYSFDKTYEMDDPIEESPDDEADDLGDPSDSADRTAATLEIDAQAKVNVMPVVDVGLWSDTGGGTAAHAYAALYVNLTAQVDAKLKMGWGDAADAGLDAIPKDSECSAFDFDPDDSEGIDAWGVSCCNPSGIPYCYGIDTCAETHNIQVDLQFNIHAQAELELHAATDFGGWTDTYEYTLTRYIDPDGDSVLSEESANFFDMNFHLASACFGEVEGRKQHSHARPKPSLPSPREVRMEERSHKTEHYANKREHQAMDAIHAAKKHKKAHKN